MAHKPLPTISKPMTPEQHADRRWLRRYATRALSVDPPLPIVPLGKDGWVAGTKVLSAARGQDKAPGKLTMETLITVVQTSSGRLEMEHDEKKGLMVRATSRQQPQADKKKKAFTKKDMTKLAADAKRATSKAMKEKHETNTARREEAVRRQGEKAADREKIKEKRLKNAHDRARRDPANKRNIADPNNPTMLAKIAPPLRRAGRGTTTDDARQAVQDRKR